MFSSCWRVQGVDVVDIAEALAARHALRIAVEAGLRKVVLETNCLKLSNHLQKSCCDHSYFGSAVNDILQLTKGCQDISFTHVKRSGNLVAHNLGRLSNLYDAMTVWMEEVPNQVVGLVNHDVNIKVFCFP
ncbi:Pre-mRNA-processing ATP-dependent RNA helicase PRP5 [Bienertia sinuspersici]